MVVAAEVSAPHTRSACGNPPYLSLLRCALLPLFLQLRHEFPLRLSLLLLSLQLRPVLPVRLTLLHRALLLLLLLLRSVLLLIRVTQGSFGITTRDGGVPAGV